MALRRQAQADLGRPSARHGDAVVQRPLGAGAVGVDGAGAVHDVIGDPVLGVTGHVLRPEEPGPVGLVVAHQQARVAIPGQDETAERVVLGHEGTAGDAERRPAVVQAPRPRVAEPQRGEQLDGLLVGRSVADGDADAQVVGCGLGVVGGDLPVPVAVEDAGVEQLVFGVAGTPAPVLRDEVGVGELGLGVQVTPPHPRVGRRAVEIPPVLLGILAVVALGTGEPEDPLLQDRVASVPEGEREAQPLLVIADPAEPVLVPAVHPRPGVVMRERVPRLAVLAVVLSHRPPRPLAQVRAPRAPRGRIIAQAPTLRW